MTVLYKYFDSVCMCLLQYDSTHRTLQWRHNGRDSVSSHQPHDCLLNRLFRRRSKKPSKLRVTGLCAVNSPGTVEFPAQMANYAENISIWWRHNKQFWNDPGEGLQGKWFLWRIQYPARYMTTWLKHCIDIGHCVSTIVLWSKTHRQIRIVVLVVS